MTHNQIAYQANKIQEVRNLEEARHNRESEANQRYATKVQEVYNQTQAALTRARDLETARHNREQEMLTSVYNETQARLASANLLLTSQRDVATISETARTNKAREEETSRHNRVVEAQAAREIEQREEMNRINAFKAGTDAFSGLFKAAASVGSTIISGLELLLG